jgi:hypothetical protein
VQHAVEVAVRAADRSSKVFFSAMSSPCAKTGASSKAKVAASNRFGHGTPHGYAARADQGGKRCGPEG